MFPLPLSFLIFCVSGCAAEEKEPYEAMARADAKRYKEAMAGYKSAASAINVDSGNESD